MKCNICGSQLIINSKGELECPVCSKKKRVLVVSYHKFNDLEYYRVEEASGILVDKYLLKEEVIDLVNKGVEVRVR